MYIEHNTLMPGSVSFINLKCWNQALGGSLRIYFLFFKRALQSYFCTIIVRYGIVVLHEFLNNMYAKVARYKSLELILFFLALPLQCSSLSCLQYFAVGKICNKNLFLGSCGWWAKLDLHSTTAFAHLSLALIWKCVLASLHGDVK